MRAGDRPAAATSLGEMLQRAGLVDGPLLETLVGTLRERLRAGAPTSIGRLLIERGIPSMRILAVATSGERASVIRCDACSNAQSLPSPPPSREFPCGRCGALLLPLGPAIDGRGGSTIIDDSILPLPVPKTPGVLLGNPEPNEDTTMPLGATSPFGFKNTGRFDDVLPIPGAAESDSSGGTTLQFNKVLPLPAALKSAAPITPPVDPEIAGGTEDPTVSLPAMSASSSGAGPIAGMGIPPTFNDLRGAPSGRPDARPAFPTAAPPFMAPPAGIPPIVNPGVAPGLPPVLQDPRMASSGLRRQGQPQPPGMDTESPTVADAEGSGGAFGAVATAAPVGTRNTTTEQKSPLAGAATASGGSREGPRALERSRSGRGKRASPQGSNFRIVFLAFAATMFVAGMGFLAFVLYNR